MASQSGPETNRARVRKHRERLRAQGLRPMQIWGPEVRSGSFKTAAHRQSLAVAASGHAQQDQDFIDSASQPEDV